MLIIKSVQPLNLFLRINPSYTFGFPESSPFVRLVSPSCEPRRIAFGTRR
ncbi:BnaA01g36540D [Brassica napus]|uniref:BnaA01g36540D protein n=2 Tax=Brassica napus TaxID=3708 RepID=A0A078IVR7_BRANA|nr:BnaA01g36540D [Brassica napus]